MRKKVEELFDLRAVNHMMQCVIQRLNRFWLSKFAVNVQSNNSISEWQ